MMISVLALASACSQDSSKNVDLFGTTWVKTDTDSSLPAITLIFKEGEVSGFSGVNRFFGKCAVKGKNLNLSDIGVTRMMGSPETMKAENAFLDSFEAVKSYKLKDNALYLYDEDNNNTLTLLPFQLEGTNWKLSRMGKLDKEGLYRLTPTYLCTERNNDTYTFCGKFVS